MEGISIQSIVKQAVDEYLRDTQTDSVQHERIAREIAEGKVAELRDTLTDLRCTLTEVESIIRESRERMNEKNTSFRQILDGPPDSNSTKYVAGLLSMTQAQP